MKKLVAIVVALMMLVAVTASAETVIKIADPVIAVNLEEAVPDDAAQQNTGTVSR